MRWLLAFVLLAIAPRVFADADAPAEKVIVGVRVRGHSKLTQTTLLRLAHLEVGDPISADEIPEITAALISSELFKTVVVTLEDTPGGVLVVATLDDKRSLIAAPTVYVLPSTWAVGVGVVENDWLGEDKKLLLYGQIGNRSTFVFGTYLDPSVGGTKLQLRFDLYALHKIIDEYDNPPANPVSFAIDRTTTENFLDGGALVGWTFAWWLVGDLRLRGAYVYYRDTHDGANTPLIAPESDGWDISLQARMTVDARRHRRGVTWGPYVQAEAEPSIPIPGVPSYSYQLSLFRAYYGWRLFEEHEFEIRTRFNAGRHLPIHQELTLGGVQDLRGYDLDQFRGDTRATFRAEYSVPVVKLCTTLTGELAFRASAFWDSGYVGYHFIDPSGDRDYLPNEHDGAYWIRNDVGVGLRVYVGSIVLPLVGLDVAYGIEGRRPEVYFEIGLTDF